MAQRVAETVKAVTGTVTLVGSAERYAGLGFPVVEDLRPRAGPLGGVEAALHATEAEWNLIVACDMPRLREDWLARLLEEAERCGGDCLIPLGADGRPQPLCAVYHRDCLEPITRALNENVRKMTDALSRLRAVYRPAGAAENFLNLNTPEQWAEHTLRSHE